MDGITVTSGREKQALKVLCRRQTVMTEGHFIYKEGGHGSEYINKDAVYPYVTEVSVLCHLLAEEFAHDRVEVVVAPAIGGIILSQWMAYHLTRMGGREVLSVYAEKETFPIPDPEGKGRQCFCETGAFVFKHRYDKLIRGGKRKCQDEGKKILVIEDVLTTGSAAHKVVGAVRAAGGKVVGVGTLCNRGGVTSADLGVPKLATLTNIKMDVRDEKDCPLCLRDVPINTDIGHGREFLAQRQK